MSIRKELTAQNVLLGFQHVLVSNVWLDPVFVAGAIGLPIALSSNMINAIFIVSGLVTLVQATRLVRLPVVQGPSAAFDALMIAAGTAGMLGAASSSILIASLVFLLLCLTGVIERMRFLFSPMISGVVIFMVGVSLSGFTLSEFLGGAPGDKTFADPHILTVSILTTAIVLVRQGPAQVVLIPHRARRRHRGRRSIWHGGLLSCGIQGMAGPADLPALRSVHI